MYILSEQPILSKRLQYLVENHLVASTIHIIFAAEFSFKQQKTKQRINEIYQVATMGTKAKADALQRVLGQDGYRQ